MPEQMHPEEKELLNAKARMNNSLGNLFDHLSSLANAAIELMKKAAQE